MVNSVFSWISFKCAPIWWSVKKANVLGRQQNFWQNFGISTVNTRQVIVQMLQNGIAVFCNFSLICVPRLRLTQAVRARYAKQNSLIFCKLVTFWQIYQWSTLTNGKWNILMWQLQPTNLAGRIWLQHPWLHFQTSAESVNQGPELKNPSSVALVFSIFSMIQGKMKAKPFKVSQIWGPEAILSIYHTCAVIVNMKIWPPNPTPSAPK